MVKPAPQFMAMEGVPPLRELPFCSVFTLGALQVKGSGPLEVGTCFL